jgi:P4 family phage/plasmid primase-like protien
LIQASRLRVRQKLYFFNASDLGFTLFHGSWIVVDGGCIMDKLQQFIKDKGFNFSIDKGDLDGVAHEWSDGSNKGWFIGSNGGEYVTMTLSTWDGSKHIYRDKPESDWTDADDAVLKEQAKKAKELKKKKHDEVEQMCKEEYVRYSKMYADSGLRSDYLEKKGLPWPLEKNDKTPNHPIIIPTGAGSQTQLIIPMMDLKKGIVNFQYIHDNGRKQFRPGGEKSGNFFLFGGGSVKDTAYIVEGFATGYKLYLALQGSCSVLVAFDIGNMDKVCKFAVTHFASVILGLDNDAGKEKNVGLVNGCKVAKKYGVKYIYPPSKNGENIDFADCEIPYIQQLLKETPTEEPQSERVRRGFHKQFEKADGTPGKLMPDYDALVKHFGEKHPYKVIDSSKTCFVFNGTHYEYFPDARIEEFAQLAFLPSCDNKMAAEFKGRVLRTNMVRADFFLHERKINFLNGWLDLGALEKGLQEHGPRLGFRYVLEYDYNIDAKCDRFDKFMEDITRKDKALENLILEYFGYSFSGDRCWIHKSLAMIGTGSNGKSTLMHVMNTLAGEDNVSALKMNEMKSMTSRARLDGKLFNIAEETPKGALLDSSDFKNIVGGGKISVKRVYKDQYEIRNRCKVIFAINEDLESDDVTPAFYRRLIMVPFNARFDESDKNFDPLIEEKLEKELSGVFNRVLEGYIRLKKNGFSKSKASQTLLEELKLAANPVIDWLDDWINVTPIEESDDIFTPTADLYESFISTVPIDGRSKWNSNKFAQRLVMALSSAKERRIKKTTLDGRFWGYVGLAAKSGKSKEIKM